MNTCNMLQFFEIVIIAFLLLISIELLLIHRDLMRNQGWGISHGDDAPGQTINVNVAAPSSTTVPTIASVEKIEEKKEQASAIKMVEAVEQEGTIVPSSDSKRYSSAPRASVIATSSGIIAKKCPKCDMENSSYRNECFNCGGAL